MEGHRCTHKGPCAVFKGSAQPCCLCTPGLSKGTQQPVGPQSVQSDQKHTSSLGMLQAAPHGQSSPPKVKCGQVGEASHAMLKNW
eukprot:1144227-Pelagomonas_calceolata.AAC.2